MEDISLQPTQTFKWGSWKVCTRRSHIMTSSCSNLCLANDLEPACTFCIYERELDLPQVPEMTFADNYLNLQHESGFAIGFNALGALKMVDSKNDALKVAVAEEWQESRGPQIKEVLKPFDWTFSTHYKGTLYVKDEKVTPTEERIDMEKLKEKAKILFYTEEMLFEDELADNGTAHLTVKIRMMPENFFILMRYFLRVDRLLVRIIDTRIFHEINTNYLLREHVTREGMIKDLKVGSHLWSNPQVLWDHLPTVQSEYDKIEF